MWVSEQKTFGEKYQPQRKNCCLDTVYLPAAFGANVWHTICLESRHRQSSDVHVWFQLEEALHSYDLICAGLHMAASYTCHLTSANMDWWQEIAAPYTEIEESQISQRTGISWFFFFFRKYTFSFENKSFFSCLQFLFCIIANKWPKWTRSPTPKSIKWFKADHQYLTS